MAFVPAILTATCYLLLNHHYYGAYLPSSATAKLGQGFSGYWGRWPTAFLGHFTMAELPFEKTKYVMYLVAVFSITGIAQTFRSNFSRLVLPFCGALLTFYILLNSSGLYFWYFGPFILFAIMYACYAIPDARVARMTAGTLLVLAVITNTSFLRLGWLNRIAMQDMKMPGTGWRRTRRIMLVLRLRRSVLLAGIQSKDYRCDWSHDSEKRRPH